VVLEVAPPGGIMIEIKTEYKGIKEIAQRLEKGEKFVNELILQKTDPLPVKKVGREYWITEVKIQEWLNN
jgi:hypothetical protein